jgi:hypothetical protein
MPIIIRRLLFLIAMLIALTGCSAADREQLPIIPATLTSTRNSPTGTPGSLKATDTQVPATAVPGTAEVPTPTEAPADWKRLPIVPVISERMVEVYEAGLKAGRYPAHFSKIGDCQNITTYFLASFDNPKLYRLGDQYAYLQATIDHFAGSWSRESLAVDGGMNVAAVQNPFWPLKPRPAVCNEGETPLTCEIRLYNPSIVTISMEESWTGDLVKYNMYLRKIVEYILSQNVVPILATRAEVPGNDPGINSTVARVAYDYQVPLWNLWAATNILPSHGLTEDGFHLTQARDFFDDPADMAAGWPWRNLTALQSIDAVYRAVNGQP